MKLEAKHIAPYLPHKLKMQFEGDGGRIITLQNITISETLGCAISGGHGGMWLNSCGFKPLLRPLSQLTQQIQWPLQTYAFTDIWEMGDDGGCAYEFDQWNIKTIRAIRHIANNNCHHDINYLPYPVVEEMFRHHFDVFGLIEHNLALPINNEQ